MEDFCRWLDPISAGSWPDWIAAVFTSLAFTVAALSYARSVRVRREAQARLVYARIAHTGYFNPGDTFDPLPHGARIGGGGGGAHIVSPSPAGGKAKYAASAHVIQATIVVHNGSNELIGPCKIQVVDLGLQKTFDQFAVRIDVIEPASDYVVSCVFPNPHHPGQPSLGATVIFRDASGTWWRRHLAEPIEHVHDDPENVAPTPTERAQYAENARLLRLTPDDVPRVPVTARWHRVTRLLRGKSPIP